MAVKELSASKLRLNIQPETLGFKYLKEFDGVVSEQIDWLGLGQDRAIEALDFGLGLRHNKFNVFVAGDYETGRLELAKRMVKKVAKEISSSLFDWCYVHNFRDPDSPIALKLPKGEGRKFKELMEELVDNLKQGIPKIFDSETYVTRKEEVIREFNQKRREIFTELEEKVKSKGFILQADQTGMMVIPAKEDGSPMTPEEVSKLSEEEQKSLQEKGNELQKLMGASMRRIHELELNVRQELKNLDRELVAQEVDLELRPIRERYKDHKELQSYLDDVKTHIVQNFRDFQPQPQQPQMPIPLPFSSPSFTQYEVNLIVDNSETKGAPVVVEPNPTYPNLFGAVERKAQFGALLTDFTMIKAGALHKANGGFLILNALDLLKWPFSYEALKRTIRQKRLSIEDPGDQLGLFTTKGLSPKPIELDVKVVLVGSPFLYYLLYNYDEEFREIFKVKAHMDIHVDLNKEHLEQFFSTIKFFIAEQGLRDLDVSACARLVEYSAELAGAQDKLSLYMEQIADLLLEADFIAGRKGHLFIEKEDIDQAIKQKIRRSSLYSDHIQELILKDVLKIETQGKKVGQVNGLSIYDLGDFMFGKPTRITANISIGKEGVVNIEREAELSGKIHTKGVMILSGYLREKFSKKRPLTLSATICFEQSYGKVDGDSASGAELFALLSALSGVGIKQSIAVTGAVSQKGEIQAVGGVSKKIEGFFELCKERGLTGEHGVIIPEANCRDLMLKDEIVKAVDEGKFHIWSVSCVEDAIKILTDMEAGEPDEKGDFPEGSLFYLVDKKLEELSELAKESSESEKK